MEYRSIEINTVDNWAASRGQHPIEKEKSMNKDSIFHLPTNCLRIYKLVDKDVV